MITGWHSTVSGGRSAISPWQKRTRWERGRKRDAVCVVPTLFCLQVWMPDTFFRNEKDGKFHDIIQPNLYVRVFPDGDVLYSIRSIIMFSSQIWREKNKQIFKSKPKVAAFANLAHSVGRHSAVCLEDFTRQLRPDIITSESPSPWPVQWI